MFIIDDRPEHWAPPHADGHRTGAFYDLVLNSPGYARVMRLVSPDEELEVACERLTHGSLTHISAEDNGYLPPGERKRHPPKVKHTVPRDSKQPSGTWRISIVARAITPHPNGQECGEHFTRIDPVAAARVQPGGDLYWEYVPQHLLDSGAARRARGAYVMRGGMAWHCMIHPSCNPYHHTTPTLRPMPCHAHAHRWRRGQRTERWRRCHIHRRRHGERRWGRRRCQSAGQARLHRWCIFELEAWLEPRCALHV